MKKGMGIIVGLIPLVLWLALTSFSASSYQKAQPVQTDINGRCQIPPMADIGRDILTYVGQETKFQTIGKSICGEIMSYEWDFDGDGIYDWNSHFPDFVQHTYWVAGTYTATLKVTDETGAIGFSSITVIVKTGKGTQENLPYETKRPSRLLPVATVANSTVDRYAIIINGGSVDLEPSKWEQATNLYDVLVDSLGYDPDHVYFLCWEGYGPDSTYDSRIDYPAYLEYVDTTFNRLIDVDNIDEDDILYIDLIGHGSGYVGDPNSAGFPWAGGRLDLYATDEMDHQERDFHLWIFCEALNEWSCDHHFYLNTEYYSRDKFVVTDTFYVEKLDSMIMDTDMYIEQLQDRLKGDFNRNGILEVSIGEVADYDSDGVQPYEPDSNFYDEDDWVGIYDFTDDYQRKAGFYGNLTCLFDSGFDGNIDYDFDCVNDTSPVVDGTDADHDGMLDSLDFNADGDFDDWLGIDESFNLRSGELWDDYLADWVDLLGVGQVAAMVQCCFSGGFIWDLSAEGRVIMTSSGEEEWSYAQFTTQVSEALANPSLVDSIDVDGCASMAEIFVKADPYPTLELYFDDNGDGVGHTVPLPDGGDGIWGRSFFFTDECDEASYLLLYSHEMDDSQGNNNGSINPGETIYLTITLANTDFSTADDVEGILRTDDTLITISDSLDAFGDILSGDTATCEGYYVFSVDSACPDSHTVTFTLYTYADDTLVGYFSFDQLILDPDFVLSVEPETLICYYNPDDTVSFDIIVTPIGGYDATVTFSDSGAPYGTQSSFNPSETFLPDTATLSIWTSSSCQPGICSTLVISATGEGITHKDTVVLIIREGPENTGPVWHVATDGDDILGDGKESWPLKTIQKGVDLANSGDTVLVENGTYEENVFIYNKDEIIVASHFIREEQESYIESTIIDAADSGWVITFDDCDEVTMCGFTIKDGLTTPSEVGGGIYSDAAYSHIRNNILTENSIGIRVNTATSAEIFRNLIHNNNANGVEVGQSGGVEMFNNTISDNQGKGVYWISSVGTLKNNIISDNTSYGFYKFLSGTIDFYFNDAWANTYGGDTVNYYGVTDPTGSNGNLSLDPLYIDFDNSDFHLSCYSPCIDAGDTADSVPPNGGSRIDMGAFEFEYTSTETICGDVDSDGCITSRDYYFLLVYLFQSGPAPDPLCVADVNCSGSVNISDALRLMYYLRGTQTICQECCD